MPLDPADHNASPGGPIVRRGYHHGRLREALLEAARDLLKEKGAAAFSLADAAKRAGVSPAAPYRHFRDKDALLTEVSNEGFALFGDRLNAAMHAHPHPQDGFAAMGRAYLAFAREHPGLYEAMFSWCASSGIAPCGEPAAPRSFELLLTGIERALGVGEIPAERGRDLALQVWAMSHGIAMLAANGKLSANIDAEAILHSGVGALIRGAKLSARASERSRPSDER